MCFGVLHTVANLEMQLKAHMKQILKASMSSELSGCMMLAKNMLNRSARTSARHCQSNGTSME